MKTGAEGYAEVQAMAKVDIPAVMSAAVHALAIKEAFPASQQFSTTVIGMADAIHITRNLIDCARTILRTGFTIEDHARLKAILERIG